MVDPRLDRIEEQARLLTDVVRQLVAVVSHLNLEAYMDTTVLHHLPNDREREFRGVSEELEDLRTTLEELLGRVASTAANHTTPERPGSTAPETTKPS